MRSAPASGGTGGPFLLVPLDSLSCGPQGAVMRVLLLGKGGLSGSHAFAQRLFRSFWTAIPASIGLLRCVWTLRPRIVTPVCCPASVSVSSQKISADAPLLALVMPAALPMPASKKMLSEAAVCRLVPFLKV